LRKDSVNDSKESRKDFEAGLEAKDYESRVRISANNSKQNSISLDNLDNAQRF